jgi:hypothetical protein
MGTQRNLIDIERSEFLPVLAKVPRGSRHLVAKAIGLKNSSQISNKRYMTVTMFAKMALFVMDMDNVSHNTVGLPAPFDLNQAEQYNVALLNLISCPEFRNYSAYNRYRLVLEQIDNQKRINRNK